MAIKNKLLLCSQLTLVMALLLSPITSHAKSKKLTKKVSSSTPVVAVAEQQAMFHNLTFLPESQIRIDGDSTVRKFSASAKLIELNGKAKNVPQATSRLPWTPVELEMLLAVKNLSSGERTLDEHMHENLKSEVYPQIQLKLTDFIFSETGKADSPAVIASGTLSVAGITRSIEMHASLITEGPNLRIKGHKVILMSDFGITPPTMMMGALKTQDKIEISFDVICLIHNKS